MNILTKLIIIAACFSSTSYPSAPFNDGGSLLVITGPMYSEKTGVLIKYVKKAVLAGYKTLVYSHSYDCRVAGQLSSRAMPNEKMCAIKLLDSVDIVDDFLKGRGNFIAIDEVQFFEEVIVDHIMLMINMGANVVVAGLDMNFKGQAFNTTIAKLCAIANKVKKLTAVCSVCRTTNATMTQRLVNGKPAHSTDDLLVIDTGHESVVKYEPRCRQCHELSNYKNHI